MTVFIAAIGCKYWLHSQLGHAPIKHLLKVLHLEHESNGTLQAMPLMFMH